MNDRDYCYPPDFVVLRNRLDITRLERGSWMEASRLSNLGDHDTMKRCIRQADYPICTD